MKTNTRVVTITTIGGHYEKYNSCRNGFYKHSFSLCAYDSITGECVLEKRYQSKVFEVETFIEEVKEIYLTTQGMEEVEIKAGYEVRCLGYSLYHGMQRAEIVFLFFSKILGVSGYNLGDAETLFMIHSNTGLQVRDVLFAGVLIAAVGACRYCNEYCSMLHELHQYNPDLKAKELFKSGINVGHDLIGTMADTLIFAYAGGSFSTMLLYMAYAVNYNQLINLDSLILELAQALSGALELFLRYRLSHLLEVRYLLVIRCLNYQRKK